MRSQLKFQMMLKMKERNAGGDVGRKEEVVLIAVVMECAVRLAG